MSSAIDPLELEREIQRAYEARCSTVVEASRLGWRLLYSPKHTLNGAKVAFIGFNPGGSYVDPSHGVFAMEKSSAYRPTVEDWGKTSRLQKQVLTLFERLGVVPEDVLAGNLVPFRSPDEESLENAAEAIAFGIAIWRRILAAAQPCVVVSMGKPANKAVMQLLSVREVRHYSVNWGVHNAYRGSFDGGIWIGLPHLSRYAIMNREVSASALNALFQGVKGS